MRQCVALLSSDFLPSSSKTKVRHIVGIDGNLLVCFLLTPSKKCHYGPRVHVRVLPSVNRLLFD